MVSDSPDLKLFKEEEEHFGNRLSFLLDTAGVPEKKRKSWLEREFSVSSRTPSLWLQDAIPRYKKLVEISSTLNKIAGLDEDPKVTEHWLLCGKRPPSESNVSSKPVSGDLDHFTKSLILKELLSCGNELDINIHRIKRVRINNIVETLNSVVVKRGESFVGSKEFTTILKGLLEEARQHEFY